MAFIGIILVIKGPGSAETVAKIILQAAADFCQDRKYLISVITGRYNWL
jgi:hypothetical protein